MATIAVVNAPHIGHIVPATRLGAALAGGGHRVIGWTTEPLRAELEAVGIEARLLGLPDDGAAVDWSGLAAALAAVTVQVTGELVEDLLGEGADLVVHDTAAPWGRVAAQWLGLPTLCSSAIFPNFYRPASGPEPADEASLASIDASRHAVGRRWGVELGSISEINVNFGDINLGHTTPEILGGPLPHGDWRLVGALPAPSAPVADSGGDGADDRPLVLMSLGTLINVVPVVFRAVLEGLADEQVRVLVATGGRLRRSDIGPVPDNATIVDRFMPFGWQRAVLERAAVLVTHCGTGTAHDALRAGVPMVCTPIAGDQPMMARRVADLGAGVLLARYTAPAIRDAVLRLLDDDGPAARARDIAAHLRAYDGASIALRAVDELLRRAGPVCATA